MTAPVDVLASRSVGRNETSTDTSEHPVDVLAVMDEAQCDAENTYGHDSQQVVELNAARAAVAELIEADKEYDAAKHAHASIAHESYKVGEWNEHDERLRVASQRLLLAGERRRAALARVGGGK